MYLRSSFFTLKNHACLLCISQETSSQVEFTKYTTYFISAHKLNSIFVQNPNYARGMEPSFSINLHGNTFVTKDSNDNWSALCDSVTLEVDQPRGSHMHWSKYCDNLCRKKEVICVKEIVIFYTFRMWLIWIPWEL